MISYLFKKVGYSCIVLLGVVTVVFFLFNVLPGDPARLTLGQRSDVQSLEQVKKELNLDKPLLSRYLLFLKDLSPISVWTELDQQKNYSKIEIIQLSKQQKLIVKFPYLGRSYRTKQEVSKLLLNALPATLLLATCAMLFATFFGVLLGTIAALKKGTWIDFSAITLSVSGISLPSFFAGLIIAYFFGYVFHSITGLNMTGNLWVYDSVHGKTICWKNLLLPTLTLGIRPLAIVTQLTRSSMLDVLSQDFIRTAKVKGLSMKKIMLHHALPNALNPVVTAVSVWLAELLAGSFFVEYIFGWKGIGSITVDALDKYDFPLVMGTVILSAFMFVIVSIVTDIIYSIIDPRIRLQS